MKQRLFCEKYIELGFNGTKAAIAAGYSKNGAGQTAHYLLNNPQINKYIESAKEDLGVRLGITRERIAQELAKTAFFDPRKLYDEDGNVVDFSKIDDDTAGAINNVEIIEDRLGQTTTKKIRVNDKVRAAELLTEMLGYKAPVRQEIKHSGDIVQLPKKDLHNEEVDINS
jgi:phage terminase small subunit